MKKNSILTVGSMAFDSIHTPAGQADQILGGSANYFSVAASFYSPVEIVAVVGSDFPKKHLQWLEGREIGVKGVEFASGRTFHWVGKYDHDLNEAQTISTHLNVFEHFNPRLTDYHRKASHVFLANIHPALQRSVLDQVESPQLVACDTMNFWITGALDDLKQTLKRVDILSINESESYLLSGKNSLVHAAEAIRAMGPSVLIIKRGEYGAVLFTDHGNFLAPAYPTAEIVDPTGAGDSFAGAFMGYLAQQAVGRKLATDNPGQWDLTLRRAVIAGCVMASFTVEDFGLSRLQRLEKHEMNARRSDLIRSIAVD